MSARGGEKYLLFRQQSNTPLWASNDLMRQMCIEVNGLEHRYTYGEEQC